MNSVSANVRDEADEDETISGKRLTSAEVANLLGVSEASVKRWSDSGVLSKEKTAGGHRRFRPEDVAVFRRMAQRRLAERRKRQASVEVTPFTPTASPNWKAMRRRWKQSEPPS